MYTCVIISIFITFVGCAFGIAGLVLDNYTLSEKIGLPVMLTGMLLMAVFFVILTIE